MMTATRPFDSAETYRAKGWSGVLPLDPGKKGPPPYGFTGYGGRWPTPEDWQGWRLSGWSDRSGHHSAGNVCLRLPPSVIGIDVDHYKEKRGGDTLAHLESEFGELPPTWISTSRSDGVSGIRFFRVPPGIEGWDSDAGPDIEVIRHAHRYAVVAPSVHPEGGVYRWIRPDGSEAGEGEYPGLGSFPDLPDGWLQRLAGITVANGTPQSKQQTQSAVAIDKREHRKEAREWLQALPDVIPCRFMSRLAETAYAASRREHGNAYDHARDAVMVLLRAAEAGHPGLLSVLREARDIYVSTVSDSRESAVATSEFNRFTEDGVALLLADPSPRRGQGCDCEATMRMPDGSLLNLATGEVVEQTPETEQQVKQAMDADVARELHMLRVRDEARRLFQKERRESSVPPNPFRLSDPFEDVPVTYRIAQVQPVNSRSLLAAQFKAGKTSMTGNLARSLSDGVPFLGEFDVQPVTGTVVIIDTEMSERQLQVWLRDQGIENADRVVVFSMRGRVSALDIMSEDTRREWVARLREIDAEYLILDCLRPILDAFGLDENHDAGRFLVVLDALLEEAGISDALVVHHMGHVGERARGDSRLRDWPDVEWRLVRQDEAPDSPRFFTAYGRDVDVPEAALTFDPATRHLSLAGGSRKDARTYEALRAVVELLTEKAAPLSKTAIEQALSDGYGQKNVREAVDLGVAQGRLMKQERVGRGGGFEYIIDPLTANFVNSVELRQRGSTTPSSPVRDDGVETEIFDRTPSAGNDDGVRDPDGPICRGCQQPTGVYELNRLGLCEDCTRGGVR
jgi:hypothetical protein